MFPPTPVHIRSARANPPLTASAPDLTRARLNPAPAIAAQSKTGCWPPPDLNSFLVAPDSIRSTGPAAGHSTPRPKTTTRRSIRVFHSGSSTAVALRTMVQIPNSDIDPSDRSKSETLHDPRYLSRSIPWVGNPRELHASPLPAEPVPTPLLVSAAP